MLVREALQAGLPIRAQVILAGFDREEKIRSPAISSDPRTVESNADSWSSQLAWRPLEDLNDIDESFAGFRLTDGMLAIVFFYVELDVGWSARIRRPCIILRENGRREKQKQGHNFHVAPLFAEDASWERKKVPAMRRAQGSSGCTQRGG